MFYQCMKVILSGISQRGLKFRAGIYFAYSLYYEYDFKPIYISDLFIFFLSIIIIIQLMLREKYFDFFVVAARLQVHPSAGHSFVDSLIYL